VSDAAVEGELGSTEAAGQTLIERLRPLATSLGPAILIVLVQQVFFPMRAGLVVQGVILGALTALIALGMALIYKANRIINFAQGDLGYVPTVLAFMLMTESGVPYGVALGIGLIVAIALGVATERLVIRRFFRAPRLLVTVATIGLSQVFVGVALLLPRLWDKLLIGGDIPPPFEWTPRIGGVNFNANHMLALVAAPIIVTVVVLFLQRSDVGVAVRASADSPDRAALLGVPVYRLQTLVWTLAAVLAFVTVFLRSGVVGLPAAGSTLGLTVLLRALVALLLGRMTDLVAITSSAVALGALDQGVFINHGDQFQAPVLGLVVLVAVVVRRREIGRRDPTEDAAWRAAEEVRPVPPALARVPLVRIGRWLVLGVTAAVVLALPAVMDVDQVFKAGTLMCFALLGLSLVLLSGWGGIVSLGHIAYFAVGAAVAGWLMVQAEVDLLVAVLLTTLAGAAVAALVGGPALRVRGIYLAVTSFAFALTTAGYLLDRDTFSWIPRSSDRIEAPVLGGFEVETERGHYYLILAFLVAVLLAVRSIRASRFGRALVALRDNDRAAQAYSIAPARVQLTAFALSGAIAALAGALFAFKQRTYDSGSFGAQENFAVFIMVVIGGMTSATGAVVGALYLLGTQWFLSTEWQAVAQGFGVIVVLLAFPGGLASVIFGVRDRFLRLVARTKDLDIPGYSRTHLDGRTEAFEVPAAPHPARANAGAAGAPASVGEALLSAQGVEVAYGGVPILFGVDIDVRQGEAVALLGTNGAGKSTLLRAISGVVEPREGHITFAGQDITGRPAHRIAAQGVLQMPGGQGVFPTLTVAENLRVAGWLHRRDRQAVTDGRARIQQLFPVLGERSGERAAYLSGGQQQMLALGMAVLGKPKLLMIDELSLGLAPSVVGELMRFVDHLRQEGTTLLVVEQSVNVALEIADRAVFLERGEVLFSGPAQDLLARPDLLRSVFLSSATSPASTTGSGSAASTASSASTVAAPAPGDDAPPALAIVKLTVSFGGVRAVDGVSLEVAPGEIVGVIGPNGAGKTTLFDLLSGFVPSSGGRVLLGGRDVTGLRASARARRGLGRSFQDARLFSSLTVDETIAAALERWVQVGDPLSAAFHLPNAYDSEIRVHRRVDELVDLLGLGPYRSLFVGELSTGTRRVVDLACLLAHRPSVVLLDEPAAGIAQREVEQLAPLIRRIRDEMGASIVLVEHDIPLVEEVADRVVAMDRGRVLAVGAPAAVLSDAAVVSSYLGDNRAAINRSGATKASDNDSDSDKEVIRATE
jgi:ABC-type branched-subunit amino acid transport system ATPase component/ABC-type branched-subunit amino acid transport system permease subunit